MIVFGTLAPVRRVAERDDVLLCGDCGQRMTGAVTAAPRCHQHPTCTSCSDQVVHCRECGEVLRQVAEDRAEQVAYDASREDDDPTAYELPMTGATYLRPGERRDLA